MSWWRRVRFAVRRYLPAEVVGTTAMLLGALAVQRWWTDDVWLVALAAVVTESAGFYGVMCWSVVRERWPQTAGGPARVRRTSGAVLRLVLAEFGPAEVVDTFTRPPLTVAALAWLGGGVDGLLVAKVASDAVFYGVALLGYRCTVRLGWRRRDGGAARLRERRVGECRALLERPQVRAALAAGGTPLVVLEPDRVRQAYRRLQAALPGVRLHYAVKAQDHPAVVDAVAAEDGWFDVASPAELALVRSRGIPASRVLHTHPVKSPADIRAALAAGVRTFVVDAEGEVDKFAAIDHPDARVLVRLAFPNPRAVSDLSTKFGVDLAGAPRLVAHARRRGVHVAGFAFHVGSQLDAVEPFRRAVVETLALMDRLEAELGLRFTVLDIGGGLPVPYRDEVVTVEQVAAAIGPLLAARADRLTVLAEPGRVVAAESMTLVAGVRGVADRGGRRWCYLDDGVYGTWSNVVFEGVTSLVLTGPELLHGAPADRVAVLAGPTCDSTDVVARDVAVPRLDVGDLVVSPAIGAYSTVTSTGFNGLPRTRVLVLDEADIVDLREPSARAEIADGVRTTATTRLARVRAGHEVPVVPRRRSPVD